MTKDTSQDSLSGIDADPGTALGFGGKRIDRRLHRGDELYVLMHCEISSEGESDTEGGKVKYTAGCRTDILCELTAAEATKIAAAHGWTPDEGEGADNV